MYNFYLNFGIFFTGSYYYSGKPIPFNYPKIPNQMTFSIDNVIDPITVNNIRASTLNHYNSALNVSTEYLLYIKSSIGNSANELKKIWSENIKF